MDFGYMDTGAEGCYLYDQLLTMKRIKIFIKQDVNKINLDKI